MEVAETWSNQTDLPSSTVTLMRGLLTEALWKAKIDGTPSEGSMFNLDLSVEESENWRFQGAVVCDTRMQPSPFVVIHAFSKTDSKALASVSRPVVLNQVENRLADERKLAQLRQQRADLDREIAALHRRVHKPSAAVAALIKWRDELALDWSGEDLVDHVTHCLNAGPKGRPPVPAQHLKAMRAYLKLSEEGRREAVKSVLLDEAAEEPDYLRDM